MLSERERRILARIEHHLVESDPDLARLFAGAEPRSGSAVPMILLVVGLVMLVTGSIVAAVPVAVTGMALSVGALFVAHTRPTGLSGPSAA